MSDPDSDKPGGRSRWSGPAAYSAPRPAQDPRAGRVEELFREAGTHLAHARADLARPLIEELARALPGNEIVRHFERQAAVIDFRHPLARAPYTPAPRAAPAPSAIDLVSFHVDLPRAPSGIHAPVDYTAVLALSFESARLRAPQARRILLTDEATRVPESMAVDEVKRFALDSAKLMYERMRVQSIYLEDRAAGRASVLMDSDVVVNLDPAPIFGEDFDVGLTWRPGFADAPFNGGMIFVAAGAGGAEFFRRARACYDALADDPTLTRLFPRSLRGWWGDQFALATLVGLREFQERTTEGLAVEGLRVRLFPCETHNFTMEPKVQHRIEDLRQKFFIHFKGNRKGFQSQYLEYMRKGAV